MYHLLSSIIFFLLILPVSCFSATTTYVYDELDRLHIVAMENGTHISYEYDEIGNILSKNVSENNLSNIAATASNGGSQLSQSKDNRNNEQAVGGNKP
jgi:hypothetical protein